jgi:hypothetical protein
MRMFNYRLDSLTFKFYTLSFSQKDDLNKESLTIFKIIILLQIPAARSFTGRFICKIR